MDWGLTTFAALILARAATRRRQLPATANRAASHRNSLGLVANFSSSPDLLRSLQFPPHSLAWHQAAGLALAIRRCF